MATVNQRIHIFLNHHQQQLTDIDLLKRKTISMRQRSHNKMEQQLLYSACVLVLTVTAYISYYLFGHNQEHLMLLILAFGNLVTSDEQRLNMILSPTQMEYIESIHCSIYYS